MGWQHIDSVRGLALATPVRMICSKFPGVPIVDTSLWLSEKALWNR